MNECKVVCYFEYINEQRELLTNEQTTLSAPIGEVRLPAHQPAHMTALQLYILLILDENTLKGT